MKNAVDVARGLLTYGDELGIELSDAELQRLAVHAQAWFSASRGEPLFGEPIIATEDGATVPAISAARRNGTPLAAYASKDEGCEAIGEHAFWWLGSVLRDSITPQMGSDLVSAEVDAYVARTEPGREIDREELRCLTRAKLDELKGPPLDPDAAIERLDRDPEFLQHLLERAARPHDRDFRPR